MVLKPSMTAVPEIGTESNFWNCLTSASFQCDRMLSKIMLQIYII